MAQTYTDLSDRRETLMHLLMAASMIKRNARPDTEAA